MSRFVHQTVDVDVDIDVYEAMDDLDDTELSEYLKMRRNSGLAWPPDDIVLSLVQDAYAELMIGRDSEALVLLERALFPTPVSELTKRYNELMAARKAAQWQAH